MLKSGVWRKVKTRVLDNRFNHCFDKTNKLKLNSFYDKTNKLKLNYFMIKQISLN